MTNLKTTLSNAITNVSIHCSILLGLDKIEERKFIDLANDTTTKYEAVRGIIHEYIKHEPAKAFPTPHVQTFRYRSTLPGEYYSAIQLIFDEVCLDYYTCFTDGYNSRNNTKTEAILGQKKSYKLLKKFNSKITELYNRITAEDITKMSAKDIIHMIYESMVSIY